MGVKKHFSLWGITNVSKLILSVVHKNTGFRSDMKNLEIDACC